MSKFNKTVSERYVPNAVSHEGGAAYERDAVEGWMNFLFGSYMEDKFYESGDSQMDRYMQLTDEVARKLGWEFVAKASFFARNELGMRSISQFTAAMANAHSFDAKRAYFRNFFSRPDDVAEVFGAIDMLGGKRSHALVRGAGDYISGLNDYTLGKYKMNGKEYNMYDLINITHAQSKSVNKYKQDMLDAPDTWEVKISTAANAEEKAKNWLELLANNKLGYMALIRNLRNILEAMAAQAAVENIAKYKTMLLEQITNPVAIKKSGIYPYQIYTAAKMVENPGIQHALEQAFLIACGNMPKLEGETLVVLDVSGSMEDRISAKSDMRIKEVGAVYAAAIMYANPDAEFIKFGDTAKWYKPNFAVDGVFAVIRKMQANDGCGYGTEIESAFDLVKHGYKRIFIISDMQTMSPSQDRWGWAYHCGEQGKKCYERFRKEHGRAEVYSFDLGNYKSQCASPEREEVHLLTALNDKIFDMLKFLENGQDLVSYIESKYDYR